MEYLAPLTWLFDRLIEIVKIFYPKFNKNITLEVRNLNLRS